MRSIRASVSGDLDEGLQQIGNWPTLLGINKSYACASYVRETGDLDSEGSHLCFVDPEGSDFPQIEFTTVQLLRENYAAWFVAMGLPDVAERLRARVATEPVSHRFLVYRYDANLGARTEIAFPDDQTLDHDVRQALGDAFAMPRFGIELKILEEIGTLASGTAAKVFSEELPAQSASQSDTQGGSYSLFPDGTFLGAIPRSSLREASFITVML
jgi:hypothetical protein